MSWHGAHENIQRDNSASGKRPIGRFVSTVSLSRRLSNSYPDVNVGVESLRLFAACSCLSEAEAPVFSIESNVAAIGCARSNGEEGFFISVTQKHLAIPSSPLTRLMLKPKSDRSFIAPRRITGFFVS